MTRLVTLFSLIMVLNACQLDTKEANKNGTSTQIQEISFESEVVSSDEALPQSALYIVVNESKVKIANIPVCEKIEKSDYERYDIPTNAIIAAGGYWAGAGDYFYALKKGSIVTVMAGMIEEMQLEEGYNYQPLAIYQNGKMYFSGLGSLSELAGVYTLGGHDESWILFLGMKGNELSAQYAEIDGMLPPEKELMKYLPSFNLKPLDKFEVNMDNLTFESDLGGGKFLRETMGVVAVFDKIKDPYNEGGLTLAKVK